MVFLFVKYQRPILQCVSHWVARPLPPLPFFHFSLSEGGWHSPAFLFQRVNQLNLQDETQICCIFLFLSQYTLLSLSQREAATLLLSPFKGLTNWIYKKYKNTYSNLFVGCHSPAFPFLKVITNYIYNYIKDKSTNTKKGWESTS